MLPLLQYIVKKVMGMWIVSLSIMASSRLPNTTPLHLHNVLSPLTLDGLAVSPCPHSRFGSENALPLHPSSRLSSLNAPFFVGFIPGKHARTRSHIIECKPGVNETKPVRRDYLLTPRIIVTVSMGASIDRRTHT